MESLVTYLQRCGQGAEKHEGIVQLPKISNSERSLPSKAWKATGGSSYPEKVAVWS